MGVLGLLMFAAAVYSLSRLRLGDQLLKWMKKKASTPRKKLHPALCYGAFDTDGKKKVRFGITFKGKWQIVLMMYGLARLWIRMIFPRLREGETIGPWIGVMNQRAVCVLLLEPGDHETVWKVASADTLHWVDIS